MPEPAAPQRPKTFLSLMLMVLLGVPAGVVLLLAAVGYLGPVIVVAGIFGLAAFHYVVWGWWLSNSIRQSADPKDFED
ncbi:MAG: hypothetical protein U0836_17460 [Pirellulales bacterium]|jgi:hypothetical protein